MSINERKTTGVKGIFPLAIVQGIPEKYENIQELFNELGLSSLNWMLAGDLKFINEIIGIQGFSSTYCCPYCLKKKPWTGPHAQLRTLGHIRKHAREFREKLESGEKQWRDAPEFFSSVNQPLFDEPDWTCILWLIPIPELHLLIGIVNKICDVLNFRWSKLSGIEDRFYKWADKKAKLQRQSYRDKSFNGPTCKKLLDKKLRLLRYALPYCLRDFVLLFNSIDRIRHACFGHKLLASYKNEIENFGNLWSAFKIDITPKVHILLDHVPVFCAHHNKGLGYFNEQVLLTTKLFSFYLLIHLFI